MGIVSTSVNRTYGFGEKFGLGLKFRNDFYFQMS